MTIPLGTRVKHKSNNTEMVVLEILGDQTNRDLMSVANNLGFKNGDYICSWIYKDKKKTDFFKEFELLSLNP